MKTDTLFRAYMIVACMVFLSFQEPNYIKRISDANYRYEFYTLSEKVKPQQGREYYWFKGGAIHHSENGMTGELIDGLFTKTNHDNQLVEQGVFRKGLKKGLWKRWHVNGKIESTQKWSKGKMEGEFLQYDEKGNLTIKGKYNNNLQSGQWINYSKKDTTEYKNGVVLVKEKKLSKEEKAKIKEEKKKAAELKKVQKKQVTKNKKAAKETLKESRKDTSKRSFAKKLFSKKNK